MAEEDSKSKNLARIRDNQRRSRQRRKEYLEELETKWRECEKTGATASQEIQAAARKVVDENQRLRQLLKQAGLSDEEINLSSAGSAEGNAADTLESMLSQRKQCGGGSCGPKRSNPGAQGCSTTASSVTYDSNERPQRTMPSIPAMATGHAPLPAHSSHPLLPDPTYPQGHHLTDLSLPYTAALQWADGNQHPPPGFYSLPHTLPDTSGSYSTAGPHTSVAPALDHDFHNDFECCEGGKCVFPNACIGQVMDRYAES